MPALRDWSTKKKKNENGPENEGNKMAAKGDRERKYAHILTYTPKVTG